MPMLEVDLFDAYSATTVVISCFVSDDVFAVAMILDTGYMVFLRVILPTLSRRLALYNYTQVFFLFQK